MSTVRERLIEATFKEVFTSGYSAASLANILNRAEVKKGAMYHYFPSKIDLAAASMEQAYENFRPIMDDIFSSGVDPIVRFEKYAVAAYEIQTEIAKEHGMVCGCPFVSLAAEMAPQDEKIRTVTDKIIGYHQ